MSDASWERVREALEAHLVAEADGDVSVVTHWFVVAAGMNANGDPMVMSETSMKDDMPRWMQRGLLHDALSEVQANSA